MRLQAPLRVLRKADRPQHSPNRVISNCNRFDNDFETKRKEKSEVQHLGKNSISIISHQTPLTQFMRPGHYVLNRASRRTLSTSRTIQDDSNQLARASSSYESPSLELLWGGSGVVMSAMHSVGIPYWGTCALLALTVRTALLPIAIHGASAAADLAKVSPEVQFLISMYQRDVVKLRDMKADFQTRSDHMKLSLKNLRGIYKRYNIKPYRVLVSPLMQLPIFWYFATDIRKIVKGSNPQLAQNLETGGALWFPDLTEPDPWYVLPVIAGILLYTNVEFAVGRNSLAGETTSKSNTANIMKDLFQSVAVFIPVFASTMPAGVQIYLVSSFTYSFGQGFCFRNDTFRKLVGLPSLDAKPLEPEIAKSYINKMKKKSAAEAKFGPPGIGVFARENVDANGTNVEDTAGIGVLAPDITGSSGVSIVSKRESSIVGVNTKHDSPAVAEERKSMRYIPEEIMEAANKGEAINYTAPRPIEIVPNDEESSQSPVDAKMIVERRGKKKVTVSKSGKGKGRR